MVVPTATVILKSWQMCLPDKVTLATQAASPTKLVVQAHTCSVSTKLFACRSVQENGEREYSG